MARRNNRLKLHQTRSSVQHVDTIVSSVGAASAPATMVVMDLEAGARPTTGGTTTIQVGQGTNEECNMGAVIKYINLFLQAAPRTAGTVDERNGWIEWALVMCQESDTVVPITLLGTQTLMQVCTNMFGGECIYTGNMPIGSTQPNSKDITLKVPKHKQILKRGDQWRFITSFRDTVVTATETDAIRLVKSFLYKSWQ